MFKNVFHCLVFAVKIEMIQTYLKTEGQPIENVTKKSHKKEINELFVGQVLVRVNSPEY